MDKYLWFRKKTFAGISVKKLICIFIAFSKFLNKDSMKSFLGSQLWQLFKYAELTEVVRQNDELFVDLLNKIWVGRIDDDVENLLKASFICESDESYAKVTLHMYAKIDSFMKRNKAILNDLPAEL